MDPSSSSSSSSSSPFTIPSPSSSSSSSLPESILSPPFSESPGTSFFDPANKEGVKECPFSTKGTQTKQQEEGKEKASYLGLDKILTAQKPKTDAHDETLFIVVHQVYELWFKQIITEMKSVIDLFNQDHVPESKMLLAVRRMNRINEIQRILSTQFKVLETMTPMEFVEFRDSLVPASGFQSFQFRELEIMMGLPTENRSRKGGCVFLAAFKAEHEEYLKQKMDQPTLFGVVEKWLERTPFLNTKEWNFWESYKEGVEAMIAKDRAHIEDEWKRMDVDVSFEEKKNAIESIEKKFEALLNPEAYEELRKKGQFRMSLSAMRSALVIELYRDEPIFHLPFEFLTSLVDLDNNMSLLRHAHATMVHRMIGARMGTGGSSGVYYLRSTTGLRYKVFNDLANVSTFIVPSSSLPPIPPTFKKQMNFDF